MDMYGLHEALNQANQITHNEVEANMDIQDENNKILSGVKGDQMKNDALNDVMDVKNAGLLGVSGVGITSAVTRLKEARTLAEKVKSKATDLNSLSGKFSGDAITGESPANKLSSTARNIEEDTPDLSKPSIQLSGGGGFGIPGEQVSVGGTTLESSDVGSGQLYKTKALPTIAPQSERASIPSSSDDIPVPDENFGGAEPTTTPKATAPTTTTITSPATTVPPSVAGVSEADDKATTWSGKIGQKLTGLKGSTADAIGKGAGTLASVGLLAQGLEGQYKSFENPNHHGLMQDLSGNNTAEKIGNVTSEIGSIADIVGTALGQPEFALIGTGISAIGGLVDDVGEWFEHKDDDTKIQTTAVASESKLRTIDPIASGGQIAEGSKSTLRTEGQ